MKSTLILSRDLQFNRKLFIGLILAVTIIPIIILPAVVPAKASNITTLVQLMLLIEFFASDAHVASTLFFYSDPKVRGFFATRKSRYIYIPIILCIVSTFAFAIFPDIITSHILLGYLIWQTYHFQRQNHGILSFFCAATESGRVSHLERTILNLGLLSGICGMFRVSAGTQVEVIKPYIDLFYLSGINLMMVVGALIIIAVVTQAELRQNRLRLLCVMLGGLFYLPTFLFFEPTAAILGYAYAHGFQYLVFMYFVADSEHHKNHSGRMISLIGCAVLGGLFLSLAGALGQFGWAGKAAMGARLGMIMAHFVIDADVWKLKEPFQRGYLGAAFDFIFSRKAVDHRQFPPDAN
jgi:hypothetical protein